MRAADAPPALKAGAEVVIDPDAPDPPEILDGPTIDVGAMAEENFVLAIDPYPRAPGAALPAEVVAEPSGRPILPFAVFGGLGKPPPEKG